MSRVFMLKPADGEEGVKAAVLQAVKDAGPNACPPMFVGVGLGGSSDIPEAIRKGKEDAAKHLVSVALDENNSVTHDFLGKYGSSTVLLKKAPEGTGIIAGGPARVVCELAGLKNIRTKALGSTNKQYVVLATIQGLSQIKTPEEVAAKRGKSVEEIMA